MFLHSRDLNDCENKVTERCKDLFSVMAHQATYTQDLKDQSGDSSITNLRSVIQSKDIAKLVAVFSITAVMPKSWLFDLLHLTRSKFTAQINVYRSEAALVVRLGECKLAARLCLDAELKLSKVSSKVRFSLNVNLKLGLPSDFKCSKFHDAVLTGSLDVNTAKKQYLVD